LQIKEAILRKTFAAAGLTELPVIAVHSGDPWHSRNRIRLRVGEVDGELRVGYKRAGSTGGDAMLPVTMCPIAAPLLWRAAEALIDLDRNPSPAVRGWLQAAVEAEFFTDAWQKKLQLTLFTRSGPPSGFAEFCNSLQRLLPELVGAGVAVLPAKPSGRGRRAEHPKLGPTWGAPGMTCEVVYVDDSINEYWVSRGAFFQSNIFLTECLANVAISGRKGTLAWDLYAGVGLFSRALAETFDQVIAVEAGQPAATDLAAALKGKKHRALAMTTLDFLQAAVVQRERPDLIVMDPPRAGVGAEVCALLARVRCPEIVYVSCDPVTLARDLKQLTSDGYRLVELNLVDMFPQTFHMETVAVLRR
jgi:23S rRNA (uracil1939-C5)-methyltransferase